MTLNIQHTGVELAAQLADRGEHVVLLVPGGAACPPDWRYSETPPTAQQLRLWMRSWPDAAIRIVRDDRLVDPLKLEPAKAPPPVAPEPNTLREAIAALRAERTSLQDENQRLRAEIEAMAGEPVEPVVAACPTPILVPILVPIIVETQSPDVTEMLSAMEDMKDAVEAMASQLVKSHQFDLTNLAGLPRDALTELLRAAMIETERRKNSA